MSSNFQVPRGGKPTATSITTSQRSTCEVVFYRFAQTDITKIERLNVTNDKSISGTATKSSKGNLQQQDRVVVRNDVARCTITKTKGNSSGTFSLTLKRGKQVKDGVIQPKDVDYLKLIHPGDWIMIYMKKGGTVDTNSNSVNSGLKFLGIVENVRYVEVDDPNRAAPRLEYIITGRDFGKVFENEIFFNPTVNNQTIQTLLGAKFLSDGKDSIAGDNRAVSTYTPDQVIKNLVSFYLGGNYSSLNSNNQTWYVPKLLARTFKPNLKVKGEVSFVDVLNTSRIGLHRYDLNHNFIKADPLPGAALIKSLPATGTVWSILQFLQNAAINEMYTELVKDKNGNLQPSLVMRQLPFSNYSGNETHAFTANARPVNKGGKATRIPDRVADSQKTFFVNLPILSIVSSNIKQKNVGKSDHERLNHVIISPKIDQTTYDILYATAYNVPSVQRHGLRSLQQQTSYVFSNQDPRIYLERCVNLLVDWFFLSHQLFNGTIVIDGVNDHLEIGTNLFISDAQQLYHIEGYTHSYEIADDGRIIYNTELQVSRGQVFNASRRASSFIGPSAIDREPTTITTSVLEGNRGGK